MAKEENEQAVAVPIEDIFIGKRGRINLGDIESLQNSIAKIGLLHPITLSREKNQLIAGFRRLTCHKNLGLKTINAFYKEDLSPVMQKIIELDENLHEALSWNEQSKLRADIHDLLQKEHGKAVKGHSSEGWSQSDTANYLNIASGTLSEDLNLIETAKIAPKILDFTSKKQALKSINKMREMAILSELARRDAEEGIFLPDDAPYGIFEGKAAKFMEKNMESETVDLVFFDPPWGIDVDVNASSRGPRGEKTFYDDSEKTAKETIFELVPEIHRVLKNNTHMYMFVGWQYAGYYMNYLMNQRKVITEEGVEYFVPFEKDRKWVFGVRELPLLWVKEGGGYTDFDYKFMPRYETILFCVKGTRSLNYPVSDVFEKNRPLSTERFHPQQKPVDLLKDFIKISSAPGELILDPCMGSGVAVVSSILTGRRSIGIENDHEMFLKSSNWIRGFDLTKGEENE